MDSFEGNVYAGGDATRAKRRDHATDAPETNFSDINYDKQNAKLG